jgi:biopolymer transport protein ExbB
MNFPFRAGIAAMLLSGLALRGADTIDDALKKAALDYDQSLRAANAELAQTRDRIEREKAPLLAAMRAAQDRIIAADAANTRLETWQSESQDRRRQLDQDIDSLRRTTGYVNTLAHDSLGAFDQGLRPGERQIVGDRVLGLQEAFADPSKLADPRKAVDVEAFLLGQIRRDLGGYGAAGESMFAGDNRIVKGAFAFVGPETFFRAESGQGAGTVRESGSGEIPIVYPLSGWNPASASAFFEGGMGTLYADASAGKALRLQETKGTVWQHIQKGGVVSYAILGVGALALLMTLQKLRDLSQMAVSSPEEVEACLAALVAGKQGEAEHAVGRLAATTRELYEAGLRYLGRPKELLEEHLVAVLLRQRLHFERWLPLLAVIATAAPLMGLLGTVTGMVRTFALITVFGTGNAGKLASGISEVLVSTELGLMVAIPTLVAHGFLSYRIQKNLSLLERYAAEFVTAAQPDSSAAPFPK